MAHIVPSLSFLIEFKSLLEQGRSVQDCLALLTENPKDEFRQKVFLWWSYEKIKTTNPVEFKTLYQKSLFEVLRQGLKGAPIYSHLILLQTEMTQEFDRQWKAYLESLPLRLSFPLLLFFFPAYVILLFGPLTTQFLKGIQ